jgi:uncharacterized repeat protein (TIGR02543 family)
MKNVFFHCSLFFVLCSLIMPACDNGGGGGGGGEPVTGVRLDKDTLNLFATQTETLTATTEPSKAGNRTVTWSSSAPAVATVDPKTGTVTAVAPGEAAITATANNGLTANCAVTVWRTPTEISILTPPAKTQYATGETLDTSGLSVRAHYSEVETDWETLPMSAVTIGSLNTAAEGEKPVTVTFGSQDMVFTTSFTVVVGVRSLAVSVGANTKLKYGIGIVIELADLADMVVTATYVNDSTRDIPHNLLQLTYNFSTAGNNIPVTISYGGKSNSDYKVEVLGIKSIAVSIKDDKIIKVTQGQDLKLSDLADLIVTVTFTDDTTGTVTITLDNIDLSGFDKDTAGVQELTVTYGGHTAKFNVTVVGLSSIAVTTPPSKTRYEVGEQLVTTNMVVTATYSDTTTENVTSKLDSVTGFDSTAPEIDQTVTVHYGGKEATFTVTIYALSSIAVTTQPSKTRYATGETLELTGLAVTPTYSDGLNIPAITVTAAHISGFSSAAATASQTVNITYNGISTNFIVKVYATVTFNPNGGNWDGSTANKTVETEGDVAVTPPAEPTRDTYAFDDWYTQAAGGAKVNFATLITTNQTFYAQWKPAYEVTFDANGGAWGEETEKTVWVIQGNTATAPANPDRASYVFDDWYTTATGGTKFEFTTSITAPRTLYAQWKPVVTFDANGGAWGSGADTATTKTVPVGQNNTVTAPENPTKAHRAFVDWYTEAEGGEPFNFEAPITEPITLYAQWDYVLPLTDVNDVAPYLATLPANTAEAPISLPVNFALGTMTQAGSGWRQLLDALNTAGKFVDLDLSLCTMTGTEFNPVSTVATGKNRIVSIALPNVAASIAVGSYNSATFISFTALKSFSQTGTALKTIGNYAFMNITSLTQTTLPSGVTVIGEYAFYGCTNLALIELPPLLTTISNYAFWGGGNSMNLALTSLPASLTSIGEDAFNDCPGITLTSLPTGITSISHGTFTSCTGITQFTLHAGITSISNNAFYGCTNLVLVTCMRTTPPTLGTNVFGSSTRPPNDSLAIKVPAANVNAYRAATNWSTWASMISAQ